MHEQAGDDDWDPKTGILLRIYDIEKAGTIIPHYQHGSIYYSLLDRDYEVSDFNGAPYKIYQLKIQTHQIRMKFYCKFKKILRY